MADTLKTFVYGPGGEVRGPGEAPASLWYTDEHKWFIDVLRAAGEIIDGEPVARGPRLRPHGGIRRGVKAATQ